MSITITEDKESTEKTIEKDVVEETLKAVEDYDKIKEDNDKLEIEILRGQELKRKMQLGGISTAGQEKKEKTPEEKAEEEAKEIIDTYY